MSLASPLPQGFFKAVSPTPVEAPRFIAENHPLADDLGLPENLFAQPSTRNALSGNGPWPGQQPVALAYAGHQFGGFNPHLGDGRAHLIATLQTPQGAFELQLKGSGPTPFSRNGDGRATLGAMLREYVVSEAMAGLGIPTTRSLAVVATGEVVYRRRREPGAVLTRVARSHVRVGTFQYAALNLGPDGVKSLVAHEMARSYPGIDPGEDAAHILLQGAISRQASLIARWMAVGFIHGVMNTDNMAISGETIDYGPCAFMDAFHPKKVFSSIDQHGRYAWDQQPGIALWNLSRFAECLLPLLHEDKDQAIARATAALQQFLPQFEQAFETAMRAKLGLAGQHDGDAAFIAETLTALMNGNVDFTLFFRHLTGHAAGKDMQSIKALFQDQSLAEHWLAAWQERLPSTGPSVALMQATNPIYIARNHQVEAALAEAETGNLNRFNQLVKLLRNPFIEQPDAALFEAVPLPDEEVTQTFCNT